MGDRLQIGGPGGLYRVDTCRVLLPLGHSSAGATRSVPSPRPCPSASRSHYAPTIPASDGGGLYTGYRSRSPMGRGQTTPSRVPTTKKGHRYRRCPRRRPEDGGCQRLLPRSGRGESRESRTTRSSSRKRHRSQSRRRDSRPTVPFPLQDHEGRLQALRTLYEEAGGNRLASEMTALRGLREGHPELGAEELQCLNNQVLLMIAEYHLTSASQGTHHVLPVLPEGAARLMPPLEDYLPGSFNGYRDVRVTDRAQILHVATWLHRLDLHATYGAEIAASPRVEDYDIGPLLEYFLMPKLSDITFGEVASTVAQQNRRDMEISLRDLHEERDSLQNEIELLARARDNEQLRETKKTLKKWLDTSRRNLHSNQEHISLLEELLGLRQSLEPPTGQGRLNVIVEETTEMTVVTADEAESGATPPGGPTQDANAPEREMKQDMETEGPGSPVTPNEDRLVGWGQCR